MGRKTYSGRYNPKNVQKYRGDPTQIAWRSLWELKCMKVLDMTDAVIEWSSEEIIIPYVLEIDGKVHRYFPDFWAKVKTKNGTVQEYLLELKPHHETIEPIMEMTQKRKKPSKSYLNKIETYVKNRNKWDAAKKFCQKRNWKFLILTEKNVGFL